MVYIIDVDRKRPNPLREPKMTVRFELTDTFGNEANYSWVRRGEFEMASDATQSQIMRRVKAELDLTNHRCRVENTGDMLVIKPSGMLVVGFVTFE
jgi:hypothetical protein